MAGALAFHVEGEERAGYLAVDFEGPGTGDLVLGVEGGGQLYGTYFLNHTNYIKIILLFL